MCINVCHGTSVGWTLNVEAFSNPAGSQIIETETWISLAGFRHNNWAESPLWYLPSLQPDGPTYLHNLLCCNPLSLWRTPWAAPPHAPPLGDHVFLPLPWGPSFPGPPPASSVSPSTWLLSLESLAGIRGPTFLSTLPSHWLVRNNWGAFFIPHLFSIHNSACVLTVTITQGTEISVWIHNAQDQCPTAPMWRLEANFWQLNSLMWVPS